MRNGLDTEDIRSIIFRVKNTMIENRDRLIELDGAMGDGDLGITMTNAFTAANEEAQKSVETDPSGLLKTIGMAIAKAAPSTMGTLLATGFMKGSQAIRGIERISLGHLAIFFHAFVQGIMDRGRARPGDKTIIDVLYPVAISLSNAAENHIALSDAIADAFLTSEQALRDTTQLKAQHGRAAYYQEGSIGKQDGGATVGMLIMKGFYQHFTSLPDK